MKASQPNTLDEVDRALCAASPAEVERGAASFDEARRGLRTLAGQLDRTLGDLDEAWSGARAVSSRLAEPLRRTREVLHMLDEGEFGRQLRITASGLASGQARVRDLRAQQVAGATDVPFDQHAQQVLRDVGDGYRDVGVSIGGQSPPPDLTVEDPGLGRALRETAGDGSARLELASGTNPADLFRPVAPSAGVPGDPALAQAAAGGGAGGAGSPMMPFMPPMGGMGGGMGGGMAGGMGGGGDSNLGAGGQRRNALQGDPSAWGNGQSEGWTVVGKKERIDEARKNFREDFDEQIRNATKGDKRDV